MLPARRDYAFIVANPHPGVDPVARLAHVNARFAGMDPDEYAIVATRDVYRDGDTTGLTYGDLWVLAERIALAERARIVAEVQAFADQVRGEGLAGPVTAAIVNEVADRINTRTVD
jgi:hypothetical protein